jgi:hypothetical protein
VPLPQQFLDLAGCALADTLPRRTMEPLATTLSDVWAGHQHPDGWVLALNLLELRDQCGVHLHVLSLNGQLFDAVPWPGSQGRVFIIYVLN